jgi:hypothetical protein
MRKYFNRAEKMKRFLLTSIVGIFAISMGFSTTQTSDILIIGSDTIFMQTFPMERLRDSRYGFDAPFDYNGYSFLHSTCWRGYVATWGVIENYLVLKEVRSDDDCEKKLDIKTYFKNNGYNPKTINGFVVADWYSATLTSEIGVYNESEGRFNANDRLTIGTGRLNFRIEDTIVPNNIQLIFEDGKLIENNIIPIEDYKIGDKLSFIICLNRPNVRGCFQAEGIIEENNGKMVKVSLLPVIVDESKIEICNIWINPLYAGVSFSDERKCPLGDTSDSPVRLIRRGEESER